MTVGVVWVSSPGSGSALVSSVRADGAPTGRGGAGGGLALHRGQQHLGDVEDLDLLAGVAVGLLGGEPVGEHHPAERAADGDLVGAGGDGLLGAVDVDPLAEVLLHPHPGTAGAAAEGAFGRPLHLDVRRSRQHLQELARRGVDLVVATQEARVVVGDRPLRGARAALTRRDRGQLPLAHQPVQQLGVVDDVELEAEVAVLVLQGVQAVRAGGDDLLDLVLGPDPPQGLDVLRGQALVDELVARTACGVAGAGLAVAEHAERDAGQVEQLGDGSHGLLGAVLVGAGAADPEQPVHRVHRPRHGSASPTTGTSKSRPLAQSIRPDADRFHGLPRPSRPLKSWLSSAGKLFSTSTW